MINKSLVRSLIPAVLLLLYVPFNRPFGTVHSFYLPMDDAVPLLTFFVLPYISYYFFIIFSYLYFLRSKKLLITDQISNALIVAIIAAYLFYFFYQNAVERPVIEPSNIFDQIYLFINNHVPPYNAFPSLHVAVSIIIWWGYYKLKSDLLRIMTVWMLLIVISTVLTKQHYLLDIAGGVILAIGSAQLINRFIK